MTNFFKNLGPNFLFMMHKYYIFFFFLLIKSISLFSLFLINRSLNEEFIYFFIVILVLIFAWRFFSDIFSSLLNARTDAVLSQYKDVLQKKNESLSLLLEFFKSSEYYNLELKNIMEKLSSKLFFFLLFWNRFFSLSFLFLSFINFSLQKFSVYFREFSYFTDSFEQVISLLNFRDSFIDLLSNIFFIYGQYEVSELSL